MGLVVNGLNIADAIEISDRYPNGLGPLSLEDLWDFAKLGIGPLEAYELINPTRHDVVPLGTNSGRPGPSIPTRSSVPTMDPGTTWPSTTSSPGPTPGPNQAPLPAHIPETTPMDVGQIAVTLGKAWIEQRWPGQPVDWREQAGSSFENYARENPLPVDVPFVDVIPEPNSSCAAAHQVWDPRANCGKGKWIKKRSRRRRKIITQAEAGQLQTLFATAGKNSEITKIWLAKRA